MAQSMASSKKELDEFYRLCLEPNKKQAQSNRRAKMIIDTSNMNNMAINKAIMKPSIQPESVILGNRVGVTGSLQTITRVLNHPTKKKFVAHQGWIYEVAKEL